MGKKLNFIILAVLVAIALLFGTEYQILENLDAIDSCDTAWMIVAYALVFLMLPGLAFFYGGMG